ncbi:MAG: hypothetical protein ACTSRF_07065 [Candidatus Freyarchaeota archaeon]
MTVESPIEVLEERKKRVLIRYGELSLKSPPVRRFMEKVLIRNINKLAQRSVRSALKSFRHSFYESGSRSSRRNR